VTDTLYNIIVTCGFEKNLEDAEVNEIASSTQSCLVLPQVEGVTITKNDKIAESVEFDACS